MSSSKFSQLIDELADQKNHSLSDVLLKAKVLAHQLRGRKFRQWINSEIDGYDRTGTIPTYRKLMIALRGDFNGPFQSILRDVPLSTSMFDEDMREVLNYHTVPNSVAAIEDMTSKEGDPVAKLDIKYVNFFRQYGEQIDGMILNHLKKGIPKSGLVGILASVRSKLLDFLLELRDKHPDLDKDDKAAAQISESEIDSVMATNVYNDCIVIEGGEMRDVYQAGQAGAMGPGAKADNFNQILREAIGTNSLADLIAELERLPVPCRPSSKTSPSSSTENLAR